MWTTTFIRVEDGDKLTPRVKIVRDDLPVYVICDNQHLTLAFPELDDVIQFADELRASALQQFPTYSRCDCGAYSEYSSGPYDGMCYECAADAMRDARADEQIAYAKENR